MIDKLSGLQSSSCSFSLAHPGLLPSFATSTWCLCYHVLSVDPEGCYAQADHSHWRSCFILILRPALVVGLQCTSPNTVGLHRHICSGHGFCKVTELVCKVQIAYRHRLLWWNHWIQTTEVQKWVWHCGSWIWSHLVFLLVEQQHLQASHHAFVLHACQIKKKKKIKLTGMQNPFVQSIVNFCEVSKVSAVVSGH